MIFNKSGHRVIMYDEVTGEFKGSAYTTVVFMDKSGYQAIHY